MPLVEISTMPQVTQEEHNCNLTPSRHGQNTVMSSPKTIMQTYYRVFPNQLHLQKGQTTKTMHPKNKQTEQ